MKRLTFPEKLGSFVLFDLLLLAHDCSREEGRGDDGTPGCNTHCTLTNNEVDTVTRKMKNFRGHFLSRVFNTAAGRGREDVLYESWWAHLDQSSLWDRRRGGRD